MKYLVVILSFLFFFITFSCLNTVENTNDKKNIDSILVNHTSEILNHGNLSMTVYPGITTILASNQIIDIEGFVIYHPTDDRMCKIRKSDFGIER